MECIVRSSCIGVDAGVSESLWFFGKSDTMELKGIKVSIADQGLLAYRLGHLARSRDVCEDIRRCWGALGAQRWQSLVAIAFVALTMDINGLTLRSLMMAFPGWRTPFCCDPKQLVCWKFAGESFV